jgi:hypothetical protein
MSFQDQAHQVRLVPALLVSDRLSRYGDTEAALPLPTSLPLV